MQLSCYIEINLICMLLLGIIYARIYQKRSMASASQKTMEKLLAAAMVLCVSDVVAILSRGRFFPGARAVIEISNLVYLVMMPVISRCWLDYVRIRIGKEVSKRGRWLVGIPLYLFILLALLNPLNNLLFSINEENLYARGPGVFLHWAASWFYFLYAGYEALRALRGAVSWSQRNEYRPLLTFLILPAIGCLAQMLLYGITSVQAGITLALILVSMQMKDNQISSDELTGINNRRAMRVYVDTLFNNGAKDHVTVMMIDVNRFKKINDTFGHAVGDIALCDTAGLLKAVCRQSREQLFLCRFGGDEFVIIGRNMDEAGVEKLKELIHQSVQDFAQTESKPFKLDLSIGHAGGVCSSVEDFGHYLRLADENMYEDKKRWM